MILANEWTQEEPTRPGFWWHYDATSAAGGYGAENDVPPATPPEPMPAWKRLLLAAWRDGSVSFGLGMNLEEFIAAVEAEERQA